ncbi:MAG: hypothetical protein H7237_07620, partial [Alkalinema sp. FL-bin-369]|nr:hypothetical protein [Leptolyngbyaceae cyanobacterium LF-bin-369]
MTKLVTPSILLRLTRSRLLRSIGLLAVALPILSATPYVAIANDRNSGTYAIGLWGDLPYSDVQAQTGVPNLIADMNSQNLAFTVHDGDFKAGNSTVGS